METVDYVWLALLLTPLALGCYIALAKNQFALSLIDRSDVWVTNKHTILAESQGFWDKYLIRPTLWPFKQLSEWTESITDPYWNGGARATAYGYFVLAIVVVVLSIMYVVLMVALALGLLYLLAKMFGDESENTGASRSARSFVGGTSHEREDLFGDRYTEHRDSENNVVGESRQKKSIFGDTYTEHRDSDGNVVGESEQRTGIFGDKYTEYRDTDYCVVGESDGHSGLLGDKYTEHRNAEGNVIGESRQREDWLGDKYTENKPREY